jgi:hypothetical protein
MFPGAEDDEKGQATLSHGGREITDSPNGHAIL